LPVTVVFVLELMFAGRSDGSSALSKPPRPIVGKLKSLTRPVFESIGLKEPPNSKECDPLVQVASSRIVGTMTNRSWSLMPANGAERPMPKVNEFGNAGLKFVGKSRPERETPTVAWFTNVELAVHV